jgi:aryl-phospho-beta-D-glucosidase BglC (GH1 family)
MNNMKSSIRFLKLMIVVLLLPMVAFGQESGVSASRIARLAKGVNVTRWFWLNDDTSDTHYASYISEEQAQAIRDAGFTHVRLPIEPKLFLNEQDPKQLDPKLLKFLDDAIGRFTAHDLAVIVDIHAWEDDFKKPLMSDPAMQKAFAEMWQALAEHLNSTDPEKIYFEVMNEPSPDKPEDWLPLQETFVKAIRSAAPEHTIIVGGPQWNGIDGLLIMKPLNDTNIVYNFHFYEPFIFTHQGASWIDDVMASLRGIPYPSSDGRCGKMPVFKNDKANGWADDYCTNSTWNQKVLTARIKQAADWAAKYDVPLTMNEFGVYPEVAPSDDRLQWFRDVRNAAEQYSIGWTVWGYDDAFGLGYNKYTGMDAGVLSALGMKGS